ncbi:MAG: DASH family cryptochrome [Synechocystis sp.]|nr:DASH family cryptochrome [Synechocystis sp.]
MTSQPVLIWFRNDLRLHDHEPLTQALKSGQAIAAVYCYDRRQFDRTRWGFPKTGALRAKFLREAVEDLDRQLRSLGSRLWITAGLPEVVIPHIAQHIQTTTVYFHHEVTSEEITVEEQLTQALQAQGIHSQGFWGTTLYHPDDLPFALTDLPDLFTHFRKRIEKSKIPVRAPLPTPKSLPPSPHIELTLTPPSAEWFASVKADRRGVMEFQGGEQGGLARLDQYFWQGDRLRVYKETRNGMLGADYSSKFSPWLALGCLSPRWIYQEVKRYEAERVSNDSTYWLIFELLWRDFFRFVAQKYGDRLFYRSGLRGISVDWQWDQALFNRWQTGQTGYPLVDANMRELALTGFMSNRGRQNVASFLCKNLGLDWRSGAAWFESCLIDYDVCSNWGNWNYTAGIGNDAREFRYFNIMKQAQQYDPQGEYVRHWLPELAPLPPDKIHQPWQLSQGDQQRFGVHLGQDYPRPCVDFWQSIKTNQRRWRHC